MATSLQLSEGAGVKQCTSAPAASNGSLLQRDFSRTFLGSSSRFTSRTTEQVRASKGKRLTVSAELKDIPRTKRGSKRDTSAAASSGVLERQAQSRRAYNAASVVETDPSAGTWTSLTQNNNEHFHGAFVHSNGAATQVAPRPPVEAPRIYSDAPLYEGPPEAFVNRAVTQVAPRPPMEAPRIYSDAPLYEGPPQAFVNRAVTQVAPRPPVEAPRIYSDAPLYEGPPEAFVEAPRAPVSFQQAPAFRAQEPWMDAPHTDSTNDASGTIAALQTKLLRLDLDLANARANKAIFYDQVQYLERVMGALRFSRARTEDDEKLSFALAEASSAVTRLETHVNRLEAEGRDLRGKLLRLDFDLTHARATKSILGERVDDLERAIAADSEATRLRDEKLSTALADATESNAALRAELEQTLSSAADLRLKVLNFSLDLSNASYGKRMLSDRVEDLERMLTADREAAQAREEKVAAALEESALAISELEHLRSEGSSLRSKLLRSDFDLAHASAHKALLTERVEDFERAMHEVREEEALLKAAFERAEAANAELEAQVEALQSDQTNLRSQVLRFSLDLAHTKYVKDLLGNKVDDLENAIGAYEATAVAAEEKMKQALSDSSSAIAEVERLREEGITLRGMILRLDLDLAHARSHKQILGAKVEDLEKEVGTLSLEDDKMRSALADAVAANAALEAEVAIVQAEGQDLRGKVLRLSLDIAHDRATKNILDVRVEDLEKKLEEDAKISQLRLEKLRNITEVNAELEAETARLAAEGDHFKTQSLRRDFDIQHTLALKKIFEDRVEDLETVIASHDDAHTKLKEALSAKAEMAVEIERLDEEKSAVRTESLMKDFDLTHSNAVKGLLNQRVSDLERVIENHADLGKQLQAEKQFSAELQSEIEGLQVQGDTLSTKLLRQDFDLTHIKAMKKIFEDRLLDLERVIVEHDDMGAKLKAADFSMAELEAQVAYLEKEKGDYQVQVLSKDFDLTHTNAMKAMMEDRMLDLESVIAEHEDMGAKLKAADFSKAELEAQVAYLEKEKGDYQVQVLSKDFDLTHTNAMKAMMEGRVNDLERAIAERDDMGAKFKAADFSTAEFEAQVAYLEKEKGDYQVQVLSKDFDLTHTNAMKAIMEGRVDELERVIAAHDDLGLKLKESHTMNAELQAEVERLEAEKQAVQTSMLRKDFDLTHTRAMKAFLDDRVSDLERVIAAHDDLGAKLQAARSENSELQANLEALQVREADLQSKLLRKDFDLAHIGALKAILDDKVLLLEGAVAQLDALAHERLEKLKEALAEAASSTAELERLQAEGRDLQMRVLTTDFDMAHERAGKALLEDKVDFLERTVANYEEVAQIRDSKMSEALSLIEELEAQRDSLEVEQSSLRQKLQTQDFDLTHALATRALLSDRVDDLQAEGELLNSKLADAMADKAALERKMASLETALAAVRREERALRTSQAELRRQVVNLQSDNGALSRARTARSSMLVEKQRKLANTEAALARAQKEGAYLASQLSATQAVRSQRFSESSEDEGEDPSVAWARQVQDVRRVQERQYSDEESDDDGPSVGKQLAKIASASAAVRREEEAQEAKAAANREAEEDAERERKASRTYQAAGASVLLCSILGTYMLWAPNVNTPVKSTAAPRNPLEQMVAPNPVEQLAGVPEAEEYSEESSYNSAGLSAVQNTLEEAADDVKEAGAAVINTVKEVFNSTPAPQASENNVSENEGSDSAGLGGFFAPSGNKNATQEVRYEQSAPVGAAAGRELGEDIPDCLNEMC